MNPILLSRLKKILILVFGGTVLIIGIILVFLPGPSFLVIPAGLAILAIEFSWARKLLKRAQNITNARIFSFFSWPSKSKNKGNQPIQSAPPRPLGTPPGRGS